MILLHVSSSCLVFCLYALDVLDRFAVMGVRGYGGSRLWGSRLWGFAILGVRGYGVHGFGGSQRF